MEMIVILAIAVTLAAVILKRSALVVMGALVIVGGEILSYTSLFSTFSTIILIGCAQLLLFIWCQSHEKAVKNKKNLHKFTMLALVCAVLSACKLGGYMLITDVALHNRFQEAVEGFLALATITMAFILLWTPPRTVALHEYKHGRNFWSALFNHGHSHNIGRHEGE